jgi:cytoskeletal protein CcmA (bactofilin family)
MAGKKITELSSGSLSNLPLSGVTAVVYSGLTLQHSLSDLRLKLVDSGSHHFTGSQHFNGDITITGSIKSLIVGTGSFHVDNPEILHVQNSGSYNIAHLESNNEYYAQVNIKNTNSGNNASTDLVLTADNGTEGIHFVDLGINSSTYTGGLVGEENDAYLLNVGKDLYIGTVGGTNHPAKLHLFAENNWENPQVTVHTGSQVTFNTPSFTEGYMYEFSGSIKSQDDLSIDGSLNIGSVNEKIVLQVSGGTSSYEFNYNSGSVFYLSGSLGDNVYNVSNVPTENLNAVSLTFIIKQGLTPYVATSYKLNNENITVSWANNESPIGNSNKTDVIGLTALRVGSSWNILGTFTTFG